MDKKIGYTLNDVCNVMLNNADFKLEINELPLLVRLIFNVYGSIEGRFWQVVFECKEVIQLNIIREPEPYDASCAYMALETKVQQKSKKDFSGRLHEMNIDWSKKTWEIHIHGDSYITVVCHIFQWHLIELESIPNPFG